MEMAAGSWVRGQTLGRGSTATVSLATSTSSGESFAVKSAELSHSGFLQREQRILSSLNCPHLVSYLGFDVTVEDGRVLCNLLMEYVSGGTITDEIKRGGGRLDELTVRSFTSEILNGLLYLHSSGIAHCDVKGSNILVGRDGRAKIADFGCANWVGSSGGWSIGGTPVFMAPEVARGEEQGMEADVWALGCTVIEMVTGRPPWPDASDPVSAIHQIGFTDEVPEFPIGISNDCKDFLSKCLMRDPKERWTVNQLLQHPFVNTDSISCLNRNSNSPKSTLDQDFWNSSEEELEETDDEEAKQVSESPIPAGDQSSETPRKRIQQLIAGNCVSSSSSVSSWTFGENWITIRGGNLTGDSTLSEDRHEDRISMQSDEPTAGSWFTVAGRDEELMGTEDSCLSNSVAFHPCNLEDDWSCDEVVLVGVEEGKDQKKSQCKSHSDGMFSFTCSILGINKLLLILKIQVSSPPLCLFPHLSLIFSSHPPLSLKPEQIQMDLGRVAKWGKLERAKGGKAKSWCFLIRDGNGWYSCRVNVNVLETLNLTHPFNNYIENSELKPT